MHRLLITGAVLLIAVHASAPSAIAGTAQILEQECHKQLKMGDAACACIGERAEDQLNEQQQALVVALVTKDQATSGAARNTMSVEEMTEAGKFMQEAPTACASQ